MSKQHSLVPHLQRAYIWEDFTLLGVASYSCKMFPYKYTITLWEPLMYMHLHFTIYAISYRKSRDPFNTDVFHVITLW